MESAQLSYLQQISDKIELANTLIDKLEKDFSRIEGSVKTRRNIQKEIKFLEKVNWIIKLEFEVQQQILTFSPSPFQLKAQSSVVCDELDVQRKLQCTNLIFFNHLVNSLYNYENISLISTTKRHKQDDWTIKVDIIANGNATWVKIIARSSESINDGVIGRGEYGSKDILEVADEFMEVSSSHMNFFKPPVVVFDFLHEIDSRLECALEEKGIILGRKYKECQQRDIQDLTSIGRLNLDVTTMLAYVSELTNGGAHKKYKEGLLNEQAIIERQKPTKPFLDELFRDKELICCETAMASFDEITKLLAGPGEKLRCEELKKKITILPDIENAGDIIDVELTSQIKERSRKIFAFGIANKAVTLTANAGFGRSAKMKNYEIPMITHSARALAEMKIVNEWNKLSNSIYSKLNAAVC